MASNPAGVVVILGTGGTIAGVAPRADDAVGYQAGRLAVDALVDAVPALASFALETQQVAQIDSKDMTPAVWRALVVATDAALAREDVAGVVITHGTDTLEETAYLLHRLIFSTKPLVLTAAMRPASSLASDGPQNLLDAVCVAASAQDIGVCAVLSGRVHAAANLRKRDCYCIDAFDSGEAGPIACMEEGRLRWLSQALRTDAPLIDRDAVLRENEWPWVEIVTSGAATSGQAVRALTAAGVRGLVVAGTGNGTIHQAMHEALHDAARSVVVWRSTRCAQGRVVAAGSDAWPSAGRLSTVQARIELMLRLLTRG